MKTKKTFTTVVVLFLMTAFYFNATAQNKDWKEGSVWGISMVRTKPGMGDEYLKSLKVTLKLMYDEAVKQGLILSYKILQGPSSNRDDFDTMILTEYKNMASTEGHDAQWDAIRDKVVGGAQAEQSLMKNRLDYREILGEKMMREIIFN